MKKQSVWRPRLLVWLALFGLGFLLQLTWTGCGEPQPSEKAGETKSEAPADTTSKDAGSPDVAKDAGPVDTSSEPASEPATPDTSEPVADDVTPEPTPEPAKEAKPEVAVEKTPEQAAQKTKVVFVVNSDFVKGSLSMMSIADRKKLIESKFAKTAGDFSGDMVIRRHGKWLFVLNRFSSAQKQDRIDVIDLDMVKVTSQIQLDPKANPHDVMVVGGNRLFVTQYGKKDLIVYEENKQPVTIDLSSLAEKSAKACTKDDDCTKFGEGSKKCDTGAGVCESDGIPEMSAMILHNDMLYVAIQGLDRNDGFKPVKSVLAVIDTKTNKLVKNLPLKGTNPTGFIKEPAGTYLVIEANSSFDGSDGGLERFDPAKETLSGTFVFTEKEAGGSFSFSSAVVVSATLGYFIVNDATFKQALIQFDPSTGKLLKTLLKEKKLSDIALNDKGELYLGDKGDDKGVGRGVRVFEAATGKELTTKPIEISDALPPSQFVFGEIDVTVLPKP